MNDYFNQVTTKPNYILLGFWRKKQNLKNTRKTSFVVLLLLYSFFFFQQNLKAQCTLAVQSQYDALAAIYNVNTPATQAALGWDLNDCDYCNWSGVTCDGSGNVVQLNIENKQLTSLPAEIENLVNLQRLYVENNQLTCLPSELNNLCNNTWNYLPNFSNNPLPTYFTWTDFCATGVGVCCPINLTWTGGAGTSDWNTAGNWDGNVVPIACTDVIIPNGMSPVINGTTNAFAKSLRVDTGATLTLVSNSTLTIHEADIHGLLNYGTVNNSGSISINVAGQDGIQNHGMFNHTSGDIEIQNTGFSGIALLGTNANFSNSGAITIDGTGHNGIYSNSNSTFNNNIGGLLHIDNVTYAGINNAGGMIDNYGDIKIDKTGQAGIANTSNAIFNNTSTILLGANQPIGHSGFYNTGTINNLTGGNIQIEETGFDGIDQQATGIFNNHAFLTFGLNKKIGRDGIRNTGIVNNLVGGNIQIEETGFDGIINFGNSTFNNLASIIIGSIKKADQRGIFNSSIFTNTGEGDIKVLNATIQAILNQGGNALFTNESNLFTAGSILNLFSATFLNTKNLMVNTSSQLINNTLNQDGIYNNAFFINQANGNIQIDFPWGNGIWNEAGDFQNYGTIHIGQNGTTGLSGILNRTIFVNHVGSELLINNSSIQGLVNSTTATFTNNAVVSVGPPNIATNTSLFNDGIILNNTCAEFYIEGLLTTSGSITNNGLFSISSLLTHTNSGTFTNNGIANYPQGNPVPNVINNALAIAPVTLTELCQIYTPAFSIENANDLNIGIYSNATASISAGSYDASTNTFTANPPLNAGVNNLYVSIQDPNGGCTRIVPWELTSLPQVLATSTLPTFANSISCSAAANFMAPNATYTNGQSGIYNISGTIMPIVTPSWASCGGTISVVYPDATDNCNRTITGASFTINIDPAPAPTLVVPSFPSSITCAETAGFLELYAAYDNGMTGTCNISGFIAPVVTKNVDACNGGTIMLEYNDQDDCGNQLSAPPVIVIVEPSPLPTITLPDFSEPIYCWEASSYHPSIASYSNGLCGNSGTIQPTIQHLWDKCDGGYVLVKYETTDNCGNKLLVDWFTVSVLPDIYAPVGDSVDLYITLADVTDVPEADDLQYYKDSIAMYYNDYCSEVVVTVVGDSGEATCSEAGNFERVYTLEISDECGNVADTVNLFFNGSCNGNYCTLSQSFYGAETNNDSLFGFSSLEILDSLMGFGEDSIILGYGDCEFILDDAACIQTIIGGTGTSFPIGQNFYQSCSDSLPNTLVNQLITMILNVRYNELFNDGIDFGNFELSASCINIPEKILTRMPNNPTVNDLINHANEFMACACDGTCGEFTGYINDQLTGVFLALNSRFHDCHVPSPCVDEIASTLFDRILSLDATLIANAVRLDWVNNTGPANDFFIIEQSVDGIVFTEMATKRNELKENTMRNYTTRDETPHRGVNYYRIKLIFKDGTFLYSNVENVSLTHDPNTVSLYPNPADNSVFVNLKSYKGKTATLQIVNSLGQTMMTQTVEEITNDAIHFSLEKLVAGHYTITIKIEGYRLIAKPLAIAKLRNSTVRW